MVLYRRHINSAIVNGSSRLEFGYVEFEFPVGPLSVDV